jgi:hypothetical protein
LEEHANSFFRVEETGLIRVRMFDYIHRLQEMWPVRTMGGKAEGIGPTDVQFLRIIFGENIL